ncbi:MAG TPA: hypothetical protein DCS82_08845 [Rhodospirillaceae bacterium]|nr:hypothetical protein [Rhodospirillaceae bacterium]HAT35809.1 hypothetical protein [Rhodospirillaceae bacterium]
MRIFALILAIFLFSQPDIAPAKSLDQVLHQVNKLRSKHGLNPLRLEPRLTVFSQRHAEDMARHRFFDTRARDGSEFAKNVLKTGYAFQRIAIQVAAGYPTAAHVVGHWELDDRKRNHILDPQMVEIGIGYSAVANDPRGHNHYWAITLANPARRVSGNWRAEVLQRVNAFRARYRLKPLRINEDLNEAAQVHSDDMADRDYFSHVAPDGSSAAERAERAGYPWRFILENIAAGQPSPDEVVRGWIRSDSHREAMLERDIKEAGIGYRYLPNDGGRARHIHYWVLVMGRR